MGGCHFIGFTPDSEFLYAGIDYNGLAEELYSATLGQRGTDEEKVHEVFTKAVGEPLKRLMPQKVEAWEWVNARLWSYGVLGHMRPTTGTYMELRDLCIEKIDSLPPDVSEFGVSEMAMARLEGAFKAVVEAREAKTKTCVPPTEGFLWNVIMEEMGEDINLTFGMAGNYNDCMGRLLPMTTLAPSLTDERLAEINAADVVCREYSKPRND